MTFKILNQRFTFTELVSLFRRGSGVLVNLKKIFNFVKFQLSFRFTTFRRLKYYPVICNVEPTNHCNLRCPMCSIAYENLERKRGFLDLGLYRRFIDEMRDYLILLCLWNVGEPLLHPEVARMVSYARDRNIFTAIHTNGVELRGELADEIIMSGLDYLSISFDGATKEIYEKFRRGADFEEVLANIRNFCKRKEELKRFFPIVNMQFIVMKENEHEMELFKKLAGDVGADKVSYKRFTLVPSPVNRDDSSLVDSFLPEKEEFVYAAFKDRDVMDNNSCKRVWISSAINYNGDVNACCVESSNRFNFGNLGERNFKDIWNDERYSRFRELAFNKVNVIDICKRCMLKDYFERQQL